MAEITSSMPADSTHALSIHPIDAPLGAEIGRIDLSRPMSDAELALVRRAWADRLVLVIRDQRLSDEQLIAFTRRFGELDPPGPNPYGEPFHKQHPEINVISNIVEGGRAIGNLGAGEAVWHADMTYRDVPPKGAVLYALEVPPAGGDTYFANMYAAYEALPVDLKRAVEGRVLIHDAARNSVGQLRKGYTEVADVRQTPGARHPLVRVEPGGRRKALFLGRRPHAYILGLDVAESEALLDALWAHATGPRFVMRHVWRIGDVVMWDNLAVLHRRDAFDSAARRVMHRTQIRGAADGDQG